MVFAQGSACRGAAPKQPFRSRPLQAARRLSERSSRQAGAWALKRTLQKEVHWSASCQ